MAEILDIVDENDNVIDQRTRTEVHSSNKLIHRAAHVFVFNSKGELLLQKRSLKKKQYAGFWGDVAGHMDAGEEYEKAAGRELKEELGISARLEFLMKLRKDFKNDQEIITIFKCIHEGPFKPNPGEVEFVKFFPLEKIKEMMERGEDFTPGTRIALENLFKDVDSNIKLKVSAPGKLFLSGEWAILELGNPGIVAAVNKRVFVEIEKSREIEISVDDFSIKGVKASYDGKLTFKNATKEQEDRLVFMKGAIETTIKYLGKWEPFRIRSWGELSSAMVDGQQKKIGFGSSAASVVSTVGALLVLHGFDLKARETKDIAYKLSTIAHYFAQGKVGSAFDVAASTYGGIFVYKRFDPKWLVGQMESGKSVKQVTDSQWPGFLVENLKVPDGFRLLVAWTKESTSTVSFVKQMDVFKNSSPQEYKKLYDGIGALVADSIPAWKKQDWKKILQNLNRNEILLRELGQKSGVPIETGDLRKLSQIAEKAGAAGKLSGSGGGDCGIAVCFDQKTADKIIQEWEKAGLYPIDATVDYSGVKVN
jgi:phosphomevalonate kinase